ETVKRSIKRHPERKIVGMIRDILAGKEISERRLASKHLPFMSAFTYLLFGTEVVRNPASLICQQMALDLISVGQLTWRKALNNDSLRFGGGGDIPMTMSESPVASSRWLQKTFNPFLDRPYHYPGTLQEQNATGQKRVATLLMRQSLLTKKWLDLQRTEEKNQEADEHTLIASAVSRWYPS
ncbi:MAG: hypothetical protein K0U12_06690, partial [Gammaproteobacteria bacterium]|nr:hypothetical protein [Gammaproteobacteria bacterium]